MKIIITEQQNEKVNRKIRFAVEKLGLEQARELMGDELIKQGYIDNPSSFLNQFNNLRPIEKDDEIYYVDNDNQPLFFYKKRQQELKDGIYWIDFKKIWMFFEIIIGYNRVDTQKIMAEWLGTTYNLWELMPFYR